MANSEGSGSAWVLMPATRPEDINLPPHPSLERKVFREYIGAQGKEVQFNNIHINPAVDVHFILAFAIDYNTDNPAGPMPNNGHFHVFWDKELKGETVRAIKTEHSNVKVMLSVGGATIGEKGVKFAPTDENSWVDNAFRTLTDIINEYSLNGVDINYEDFDIDNPGMFARCIGRLLEQLKKGDCNIVTSIAPYKSDKVERHYEALWLEHQSKIDYVNYQFYADNPRLSEAEYINNYCVKRNIYGRKLLAAINTSHPDDVPIVHRDIALQACRKLATEDRSLQAGIFIWSADSSVYNKWKPSYEEQAQEILQLAST